MRTRAAQGSGAEWAHWSAPGCPAVVLRRAALDGILAEALQGLNAVPHRGVEVGGLLLGARRGHDVRIDDFKPIPCEHRFGPSFQLSRSDLQHLEEALLWASQQDRPGLSVVGFYRSHTRPEFTLSPDDQRFFFRYFPDPGQVFLLIEPNRLEPTVADFFFWRDGRLEEAFHPVAFPFDRKVERPAAPPTRPQPVPAAPRPPAEPETPSPADLTPPRLLLEETPGPLRRAQAWAAVALLALIALLGYGYLARQPDIPPPAPLPHIASTAPVLAASAPVPAAPPLPEVSPVPVRPKLPAAPRAAGESVRGLLERWANAVRRGEIESLARFYAPSALKTAQWRLHRQLARYGPLTVNRVTRLDVVPLGSGQAIATLRRHWETEPGRKYAREIEERLRLVRTPAGWRIASQREIRQFWAYRPR